MSTYFTTTSINMNRLGAIKTPDDARRVFKQFPEIHERFPEQFYEFVGFACLMHDNVELLEVTITTLHIKDYTTMFKMATRNPNCPGCLLLLVDHVNPVDIDLNMNYIVGFPTSVAERLCRYFPTWCVIHVNRINPETLDYVIQNGVDVSVDDGFACILRVKGLANQTEVNQVLEKHGITRPTYIRHL